MQVSLRIRLNSVFTLLALNVVLFIVMLVLSALIGNVGTIDGTVLNLVGGLNPVLVITFNEWWRLVTSLFLHANFLHLFLNMWALWQLGTVVNHYFDGRIVISTYVVSGMVGGLFSLLTLGTDFSVGASGAVFGFLGLLIAGSIRHSPYGIELPFTLSQLLPLLLLSFIVGFVPSVNINNWAHLGGFLGGLGLGMFFFRPQSLSWSPRWERWVVQVFYWFSLSVLAVSFVFMVLSFFTWLSS